MVARLGLLLGIKPCGSVGWYSINTALGIFKSNHCNVYQSEERKKTVSLIAKVKCTHTDYVETLVGTLPRSQTGRVMSTNPGDKEVGSTELSQ
jgi:hypothetical protein